MPMPLPRDEESHDRFMTRCMADDVMRDEFEDLAQRQAVCERQWKEDPASALRYSHVLTAVREMPWAILPERLARILDLLTVRAQGGRFTGEEIQQRIGAGPARRTGRVEGAVAVLPLYGVLAQRMGMFEESSGGTSTERVATAFRAALAAPDISAIVLDVDSPGGSVYGVSELADEIYRARGTKPIIAVANSLAASAAYWIATAADELVVTPGGEVGSIGVLAAHQDLSALLERQGIKTTLVSAGRYKAEASPFESLAEDAREHIQSRVSDYYRMFTAAVARHRGVAIASVRNGFGEGRVVGAKQALDLGMADRVESLQETLARLLGKQAATQLATGARASGSSGEATSRDTDRRRRRLLTGLGQSS